MSSIPINIKQSVQILIRAMMIIVILMTACTNSEADNDIAAAKDSLLAESKRVADSITVEELAEAVKSDSSIIIIDIRTQGEYDQGHIKKSHWVPRGKLEFIAAAGKLGEADARYILYCRIDGRGALAAATMIEMGFTNVKYLIGGFKAWAEAGHSIFNMHGEMTVVNFEKPEEEPTETKE